LPAESDQVRRLRDLHDDYLWKVNAAVGDGREDLIRRLVDDFEEEALRLITGEADNGSCIRRDCPVCARPRPVDARTGFPRAWCRRIFRRRPASPHQLAESD
jgi:hypothetical protein